MCLGRCSAKVLRYTKQRLDPDSLASISHLPTSPIGLTLCLMIDTLNATYPHQVKFYISADQHLTPCFNLQQRK